VEDRGIATLTRQAAEAYLNLSDALSIEMVKKPASPLPGKLNPSNYETVADNLKKSEWTLAAGSHRAHG
jgi:hypothetical protein